MRGESDYIAMNTSRYTTLYDRPMSHSYLERAITDQHHRLIISAVLDYFHFQAGEHLLEIGAGQGRYTELLLYHGALVKACEPDEVLFRRMEERLGNNNAVSLQQCGVEELMCLQGAFTLVCGFHVLHHLGDEHIAMIGNFLKKQEKLRGWFFIEPNPWNMLYPLQVISSGAMKFREEGGIWRGHSRLFRALCGSHRFFLGTVGLFPPRKVFQRLPVSWQALGTTLCKYRNPFSLYEVYGASMRSDGAC